jgi:hypothetical protein
VKRRPAILIVLGVLTAIQVGTGLWRVVMLYLESLRKGVIPFAPTFAVMDEIGLSCSIVFVAWWWLPKQDRSWSRWAIHFIVMAWTLALVQLIWVLWLGYFEHGVSWATLLILFIGGIVVRAQGGEASPAPVTPRAKPHPALLGAFAFWLLQAPHLFFRYHWVDTKDIWACRTVAFDATGSLTGIFDCLDPARPPLQSILLWLGHTNGIMEGRLLPFLLVGAFGIVLYRVLRGIAPTLAPWGALWFFMTVRVYQGAINSYADVPVMLAIGLGILLAVKEDLVPSRWQAVAFAVVAGAAATLIKRDGGGLVIVATGVIWWFAARRRDPRLYAAMVGAIIGFGIWSARPAHLSSPAVFDVQIGAADSPGLPLIPVRQEGVPPITPDTAGATLQTYLTMFYGMQGQMLSHYGFGMFVPCWIILAVWLWRRHESLSPEGRLYTWLAVFGWLAIVGIYVLHVSTGHAYRGTLRVIRTAFGRHLVHMFVFALLSAVAIAEVLVARARARAAG